MPQKGRKVCLNTYAGTIDFMAPEIIQRQDYDQQCDLWSLGVIAFMCLSGNAPFSNENEVKTQNNIISCNYEFVPKEWEGVSSEAKKWI